MDTRRVVFGNVEEAGNSHVNINVKLQVKIIEWETILSFYANVNTKFNGQMKIAVTKELIVEDWVTVPHGAIEIAKRYMINEH